MKKRRPTGKRNAEETEQRNMTAILEDLTGST